MKYYKIAALLLALALLFSLAACKNETDNPTGEPTQGATATLPSTEEPSAEPTETPGSAGDEEPDIRLAVLSGPTGIGAAKLLDSADNDPASLRASYDCTICADNTELVPKLTQGKIDIATMASNMAANLYNKNDGEVQIIAAGTLGVLHILEGKGGASIQSIEDLRGETVYAPSSGQGANPEYILRYLLEQNGLTPGEDVEIVFEDATVISAGLSDEKSGIRYAMLPVPAATAAIAQGQGQVRAAIDVTEAWNELQGGSQLVMTAVVARTQFVEEHPELVDAFLADYEESINYVNNNIDAAAELVAGFGLAPNAAIAKKAIPQCHLAFISGNDMVDALSGYFHVLWSFNPDSIGGSVPDDGIWYIP